MIGQYRAEIQVVVSSDWGVLAGCDQACYNVNEIHQETHQPAPAQAQISTLGHASLELIDQISEIYAKESKFWGK